MYIEVDKIVGVVENILGEDPHLTRNEAIKFFTTKRDNVRRQRQCEAKNQRTQEIRQKGKSPKGRIKTVSGVAVSPRWVLSVLSQS